MKQIHMVGNAHIDPIWLWQWREGYHEVKATFRSALDRLSESDDVVFTAACAAYYKWVKENDPAMFEEIRARVKEGRWTIAGGMWIQPDCNIPSGESFARHLLYSQRFFREEFGIIATTGYNVDSFGHNGNLPALLTRAGIDSYIYQRPGDYENDTIPGPLMRWTAPDGSSLPVLRIGRYNWPYGDVSEKIELIGADSDKAGYPLICFYGMGNHGGGPTVKNIASIHAYQRNGARKAEIVFSDPDRYFRQIRELDPDLPVWKKELQHHASGCYSAASVIKRLNRRTENALIRCEFFSALASKLVGQAPEDLRPAWEMLLFNQFHDVLCGCAIREAYDDAENQLRYALNIADQAENRALQQISWAVDTVRGIPGRIRSKESHNAMWELDGLGTPIIVFNPHPFEARGEVRLYSGVKSVTDENDDPVPSQVVRASRTNRDNKWDSIFEATVPALGYRLYWAYLSEKGTASHMGERALWTPEDNDAKAIEASGLGITEHSISNSLLRAEFDPVTGAMTSLIRNGTELLSGPALPKLFDIEHCDTWGHMVFRFDREAERFSNARFRIVERGPVRVTLRVTQQVLSSELVSDYTLYAGGDRIEVRCRLDLREKFRMLKLCFPLAGKGHVSHAEIAYSVTERPADGCEEHGQRWMELGNGKCGLALLNDSKYSFCAEGNELRLTAANTSIWADHYGQEYRDDLCIHADLGPQEFSYTVIPYTGPFRASSFQHAAEVFNRPLPHIAETYHEGPLPVRYEGLRIDGENLTAGALKRAEDGKAWILRIAEIEGQTTRTVIKAPMFSREIPFTILPYAIETLRIPDDPALPVTRCDLKEDPVT